MTVAHDARDLPFAADTLPELNKLEAPAVEFAVFGMAELMGTEFDRAEIRDRQDAERARHKVAPDTVVPAEERTEAAFHVGEGLQAAGVSSAATSFTDSGSRGQRS